MSDIVIQVENLSKYYRLGLVGTGTLSHDLNRAWAKLRGKPDPTLKIGQEDNNDGNGHIWALQDISFEVTQGEVLGIIGRNGAGKSTLLKILSRVTAPTSGECRVKGRIASLLEVGTGFHPELTGRENIFLNGAILGMTKKEIKQKFDKIVAFAEVEKFIDTPVKRYSSGMYVRLAFAVAAHLDPEILVVDEVLAVGDAAFQKKCLGKMGDVAREGRTVLFVSHNMGAVQRLCIRGVLLDNGYIVKNGNVQEVITSYLHEPQHLNTRHAIFDDDLHQLACILEVELICPGKDCYAILDISDQLEIHIKYAVHRNATGVNIALSLSRDGTVLFNSFDIDTDPGLFESRRAGIYSAQISLPHRLFKAGCYSVSIGIGYPNIAIIDSKPDAISFALAEISEDTTIKSYSKSRPGELLLSLNWNSTLKRSITQ